MEDFEKDYLHPLPVTQRNTYELRLVTALASHGNENEREAQFLPSSVKGVYRYWFRAVNALDKSVEDLREAEADIFGSTSVKDKIHKSFVTFGTSVSTDIPSRKRVPILYHKKGGKTPAFPENSTIELSFTALRKHERHLDYLHDLTQIIMQLGGFGLRARRGLGSCQLENAVFQDVNVFSSLLKENIQHLKLTDFYNFSNHPGHLVSIKKEVPVPFRQPALLNVWIGKPYENPNAILKAIGQASSEAKKRGDLGNSRPRQASPLHVTVRKIGGMYYPIMSEVGAKDIRSHYRPAMTVFLKQMGVEPNEN